MYSNGTYFAEENRHSEDATFKVADFLRLFQPFARRHELAVESYVDVGCGSGAVVKQISESLRANGMILQRVKGYDVAPHVGRLKDDVVEYVHGDFCASNEFVDLVTLFDVFEHVPNPTHFLRLISQRCKVLVCRIPLDDSWNNLFRDRFRKLLEVLGHLTFMDTASALNLMTSAGLRVVDYSYSREFLSPSGHQSLASKLALPFRYLLAGISPWLLSKTMGGVSLTVIALTESGLRDRKLPALL